MEIGGREQSVTRQRAIQPAPDDIAQSRRRQAGSGLLERQILAPQQRASRKVAGRHDALHEDLAARRRHDDRPRPVDRCSRNAVPERHPYMRRAMWREIWWTTVENSVEASYKK